MPADTQTQNKPNEIPTSSRAISGEGAVGFAILGCEVAGTIGVLKALSSEGLGAAACLLASVIAFGAVCYIYFRRD